MSDAQLMSFFKKSSTGSVCGRFMDDQLNRNIQAPRKTLPWIKYSFQVAIPAMLVSMEAKAQYQERVGKVAMAPKVKLILNEDPADVIKQMNFEKAVIRGAVVDENGLPIPYCSIIIKGTKRGVLTDSSGNFFINTEASDNLITLIASRVGFSSNEKIVDLKKYKPRTTLMLTLFYKIDTLADVSVTATNCGRYTTGLTRTVVTVGETMISKTTFFQNLKDSLSDFIKPQNKFSVYPNPIAKGQIITIEGNKLSNDNYAIELINLSGQVVQRQLMNIDKRQRISFNLPSVAAGAYFIKLTAQQSGKSYTEKIIVE
ncbi:MAG: carboxypeptidase-like regulatory domain-containing protein [Chitinophagaceae bacterium]